MNEQKVTFRNNRGQGLEALLAVPSVEKPPIVIVSPSLRGDKNYQPVLTPCAIALCKDGFAVLRYDAAGFGDSEGKSEDMTITSQTEDLSSALDYVRTLPVDSSRVALLGFSIGTTCAILNANQEGVKTLVLWSPPFEHQTLYKRYLEFVPEMKEKGYFDSNAKITGRPYRIGKAFHNECGSLDLTEHIRNITIPTFAIYAEEDGIIKLETVKKHMELITKAPIRTEVIPKANHDFIALDSQEKVINLTKEWLNQYLK